MTIKSVLFCELATNAGILRNSNNGNNIIELSESEFKLLSSTPMELFNSSDLPWIKSNAYLFGPLFDINSYNTVAIHENDVGQTGLLDVTNITAEELRVINNYNLWINAYELDSRRKYVSWSSAQHLRRAKQMISNRIMFVGDTEGGDVGAKLLVHRTIGIIDSIIIMSYSHDDKIAIYDSMLID